MELTLNGSRIWVTGSGGMIGRELCSQLRMLGAKVFPLPHTEYDLLSYTSLELAEKKYDCPEYVFHLAGYNGGIELNRTKGADIFGRTMQMALNVFNYCANNKVKKVVTPLTSCGYPPHNFPLKESMYLEDAPHSSVESHGYCRRAMLIYGKQLNKQYGNKFVFPIFNNSFGPFDRFNEPDRLKVAGALIKKFCDATIYNEPSITLWGTGEARRELIYSADFATGLICVLKSYEDYENPINIGLGTDVSIKGLATFIKDKSGFKGEIIWDTTKPNGAMSKLLDVSKMKEVLSWANPKTSIAAGLEQTIQWYNSIYNGWGR